MSIFYSMPDEFPPDYSTVVGQIRLLIPDVELLENTADPAAEASYIFNDDQLQAFAAMYNNNVKLAAAQAKNVLATSEALINKVIRTADYTTDGAKLAAELRAQAKELREEAKEDALYEASDSFTVVGNTTKWDNSWL